MLPSSDRDATFSQPYDSGLEYRLLFGDEQVVRAELQALGPYPDEVITRWLSEDLVEQHHRNLWISFVRGYCQTAAAAFKQGDRRRSENGSHSRELGGERNHSPKPAGNAPSALLR